MLGTHEPYLTAATGALAGVLASDAAERWAAEARGLAAHGVKELPVVPIAAGSSAPAIEAVIDRYNHANPRNLLFAVALLPDAPDEAAGVMAAPAAPAPTGDDPETILADVLRCHGGFVVPGLWRELAAFPHVLEPAWRAVRPLGAAPAVQDARAELRARARGPTAEIAVPEPRAMGMDAEEARSVHEILGWFAEGIAAMVVEIEYLRRLVRA
jgi:hypothetical protein